MSAFGGKADLISRGLLSRSAVGLVLACYPLWRRPAAPEGIQKNSGMPQGLAGQPIAGWVAWSVHWEVVACPA